MGPRWLTVPRFRFSFSAVQASNRRAKCSKTFSRKTIFEDKDETKKICVRAPTCAIQFTDA
jgi:hypothetical protein